MKIRFLGTLILLTSILSVASLSAQTMSAGKRTAALDGKLWAKSKWISAANAPVMNDIVNDNENCRAADGASWFLSEIRNEKGVKSAVWMCTGLGVFDVFVNGNLIGEEVLKPGFTHVKKTRYSFTYDVTDVFKIGAGAVNQLSAQVTPGWWADKVVSPRNVRGMLGKKCAFRAVLQLTFEDGTVAHYGTDTQTWKAGIAGPVTHAGIFDGEEYDARITQGFATPEKLSVPEINKEFTGTIYPTDGAEVYFRRDLALSPVQSYVWKGVTGNTDDAYGKVSILKSYKADEVITLKPGETLVIDFGQNSSAVPEFTFKAAEGTVLTCLPGEMLNDGNGARSRGNDGPEGSVHRTNLRSQDKHMRVVYTFGSSKDFVTYCPRYTFFGYRYISVTATDKVQIKSINSIPVTSVAQEDEIGTIKTGHDGVNRLIQNARWGMMSNYLSIPTDCPQRNERVGWSGDTQVFAETGTFFANTNDFLRKWMRDMRDTQSMAGGFAGVAPLAQYGSNMTMRVGWADAGIIVPWTVWKQFGDVRIVNENWAAMEKFMNHVYTTYYDHGVLMRENFNYQWADHLSFEALETHDKSNWTTNLKGKRTPGSEMLEYWNYLGASYMALDAQMMLDMAAATGRDTSPYKTMLTHARDYLQMRFLKSDGSFVLETMNTMQTPALFALRNNLLKDMPKENMISRLRENFEAHGNRLQTGFLGTSLLMTTLAENGMNDVAYELLLQRECPSWLYSVDNGATTIWERWNSYTKENGFGPKIMNSFNHYAYGCVCEWIWETAAGIKADTSNPGFKHIILAPVPDKRLGFVEAEYKSASGIIKSSWRYEDNKWIWNFTIPEGTTASVTLPGQYDAKEYTSGTYQLSLEL